MSVQYTQAQQNAICARGHALLVSAAAGSGKTAVLVQRILRYLMEERGDIRRLVVMSYTEAAAAEMTQKIRKAVDEALQRNPEDPHLQEQSALVESARISTVHSYCLSLITRFFERLKLDPCCRMLDDQAEAAMIEEEAEDYLEELNGREEPAVIRLLDSYASGRDDEDIKELLIRGMKFLDEQPLPRDYVERALAPYCSTEPNVFDRFPQDGLYTMLLQNVEALVARCDFLIRRVKEHRCALSLGEVQEFFEQDRAAVAALIPVLKTRDYDAFYQALAGFSFPTFRVKALTAGLRDALEEDELAAVQAELAAGRDSIKEEMKKVRALLSGPQQAALEELAREGALLETLLQCCMELRDRLAARRRRQSLITFHDMEQMAVELLVKHYDPDADTLTPTPLALQLREEYDEIIVDEFQDTNRAQDLIFRAVSREESNLFMVGDLKQSIYRFRGAEPEIFNQKRQNSVAFTRQELTVPTVLELNANFRSHRGVLEFANRVFRAIMSPALGGVEYDAREELIPKREFLQQEEPRAELHLLQPETDPHTGLRVDLTLQHARYTARLIAKAVKEKEPLLLPDGVVRPIEYRDFAILLRIANATAKVYEKELLALGIPVINNNKGERFFELPEVQSVLAYLLVINNPYDDVALVSLLYGDYFRFTVGELAEMRHRNRPLYDDLKEAAALNPKAARALETIEGYRSLSGSVYVYDLLYRIYQESGVFAAYAAGAGGAERCANLELLAEDARTFEADGYRGLYAFVQHVRISESGSQSGARLNYDENCVRILSIHKSKGLEFPVCIVGDCHKTFRRTDRERVLFHPVYGIAAEELLPEEFYRGRSLAQRVMLDQILGDEIGEAERVFYVALTRPVSKTILLLNAEEEKRAEWLGRGAALPSRLPAWMLKNRNGSYAMWMFTLLGQSDEGAALRQRYGIADTVYPALGVHVVEGEPFDEAAELQSVKEEKAAVLDRQAFWERMNWRYPHAASSRLPAKLSVSELKGLREQDPEAQPLFEEQLRMMEPRFVTHFAPRGNEVGNALHQALQFCDFERLRQDPAAEVERLVLEKFILESQRALIPVEKLRNFTQSACFARLLSAEYYSKEERFLFPMEAGELFGDEAEGEILIQGVLDCYSVNGNEAVLLDYKTDRVDSPQQLIDRYGVQMELYAEALKRVKGLKVIRKEIYSFCLEKEIIV